MQPTSKHALITIVAVALALAATVARAVETFIQKPVWADKPLTLQLP